MNSHVQELLFIINPKIDYPYLSLPNTNRNAIWTCLDKLLIPPSYLLYQSPLSNMNIEQLEYKFDRYLCRKLSISLLLSSTDYGRPVRKSPSLHGRKSTPTPKILGTTEAYFVCHIGHNFQISLIYAFIGCP